MSQRELWMAGNLFKHVERCSLGLYALGDLLKAVDVGRLEETTLNSLGHVIYEIGSSLAETVDDAKEHCKFPDSAA